MLGMFAKLPNSGRNLNKNDCIAYLRRFFVTPDRLSQRADRNRSVAPMAKTILVVDDSAYVRQALCELFQREADFEICGEAENGKEAIAKALELHPDLIVLDLSMPIMNGLDAARELKQLMPTVPLIMYSSFGDAFAEQQARVIGISEVVSKSQPAAILVSKARSLLYRNAA